MADLYVNINRASKHGGALILQRLFGMPHREIKRGGEALIKANAMWLVVPLEDDQAHGYYGLLRAWGVPDTAVELRTATRGTAAGGGTDG